MPKFKVEFIRTVREYHTAFVTADEEQDVEHLYECGELNTTVDESKIINEEGPYILLMHPNA